MTPEEVERSVKALTRYDWSSDQPKNIELIELDALSLQEAMDDFRARRGIEANTLTRDGYLEAIGATQNGVITRGGLLFLGTVDSIRKSLGDFEFRFTWKMANGQLVVNDIWSGNLWRAVRRARDHFKKCNTKATFKAGDTSFEAPLLDDIAFHEAYLNALVHRDYSVDGMTSVTYSGDDFRIHSPGEIFWVAYINQYRAPRASTSNKNLAGI